MNKQSNKILVGGQNIFFVILDIGVAILFSYSSYYVYQKKFDIVSFLLLVVPIFAFAFIFGPIYFIACVNVVELNNDIILKKGIFHCSIRIADITEVKKITYPIDDEYYVLVDNKHDITTRTKKNSAICVPCNEKGYKFLKSFLSIDIPLYY